jgi:hypothetical protein
MMWTKGVVQDLRKKDTKIPQNNRSPSRDTNTGPSGYEAGILFP